MKRNHLVILALCCVALAMAAGAFFIGPPGPDAGSHPDARSPPSAAAPTSRGDAVSPTPASGSPAWGGMSVSSFGAVPGCSDPVAVDTVVGALRKQVAERILGLANVHVLGHSQIGDLVQWDCSADAQQGDGQQRIRYQISREVAGRESWQLTLRPAAP